MFWKILLCLVLLVGCTATPKDDIDTQNPVVDIEDPVDDKIEEPVVTFDWVIRKQYNNSIGKLGSKYRYYPFEFETDGDSFKFNYKGPGDTEEYVILGNWNEEKVYFEFPKVEFTIKEQYVLTQLAEVENGEKVTVTVTVAWDNDSDSQSSSDTQEGVASYVAGENGKSITIPVTITAEQKI